MIETLQRGTTDPLKSIVNPPNNSPTLVPFSYDPKKAKDLLAAAGLGGGFQLTIHYSTRFPAGKETTEVVASYLEEVGIKP